MGRDKKSSVNNNNNNNHHHSPINRKNHNKNWSRIVQIILLLIIICRLVLLNNSSIILGGLPKRKQEENRFKSIERLLNGYVETTTRSPQMKLERNATSRCRPLREPNVEWQLYSSSSSSNNNEAKNGKEKNQEKIPNQRLLIGLYSGYGKYTSLLNMTAKVNRAYAKLWHHDFLQLHGTTFRLVFDDDDDDDNDEEESHCDLPKYRSTYNKLTILQAALVHREKYDQLLILDTDALVYDFNVDVTTLLPPGHVLAAQQVFPRYGTHTHTVNIGVTLWDLHHPQIHSVVDEWIRRSKNGIVNNDHRINDQYHLHETILHGNYKSIVYALPTEFQYGQGTVIKHFIRTKEHKNWNDIDVIKYRIDMIQSTMNEICQEKFKPLCDDINVTLNPDTYIE